ncbi:MAG: histidinol-phosphatase HisJ family protein [Clostridia bacterium]|nr:histidinol-phosphatase HisJ family protein [Clostridia bacterium]
MIDAHTHTHFSFDGKSSATDMAERGKALGLEYMAFTDHYDRDYAHIERYKSVPQMVLTDYVEAVTKMKEQYPFLALGIECGYSELSEEDYATTLPYEKLDYVLNSIHTVDGVESYGKDYFEGKTKEEAYGAYLKKILKSLDAKYDYDTVSHIGYVRKSSPYPDPALTMKEFGDVIDEILKKVVQKGKTIEINSNIKSKDFMPTAEIIKRYRELGGENVTFSSDAHIVSRVGEMYDVAKEMVKSCGFSYWTVYRRRTPVKIKID